jgi:hypothetical protein
MSTPDFECDLEPDTHMPRVRFNYRNGWSASLLIRTGPDLTRAMLSSVAACPSGRWQEDVTELLGHELSAGEAITALAAVAERPVPSDPLGHKCPTCDALPGQRCSDALGREKISTPHAARSLLAGVGA